MTPERPTLTVQLSGHELRRWYWLKTELTDFARRLGVSTAGGKQELADRLATVLDGRSPPPPPPPAPLPRRAPDLRGALAEESVIPAGQACSQLLRAFFQQRIGPQFRFDAHLRSFIAGGAGQTLGDAVDHWYATRSAAPAEIGTQFEFNRFIQAWHRRHPDGTRSQSLAAWQVHRSQPVEARLDC